MTKFSKLNQARITGVVTCLPNKKIDNSFFSDFLNESEIKNIEKMAGVKTRYWVDGESTVDLCVCAGKRLIDQLKWKTDEIDAIIFVTQSPDYILPASSIKIAGQLGLEDGVIAYDVNLGCSGYPYGLFLAETLIGSGIASKVLLMVGETTSKIIDKKDKSTALIFGDAGAATALESSSDDEAIYLLGSDASGERNLIVPNSRFCRNVMLSDPRMNGRNHDHIFMDGAEVFNFTLKKVPLMVSNALELSGGDIDFFLFHQANKFMLNHLVKKMKLDPNRVPINIEQYGNTSSASIPLLLTTVLKYKFHEYNSIKIGMFGFGVGYSWAACIKKINSEAILENIFFK
jgi:3-oxoacyl-[acyl-carrier-protein] synthase-3